MWLVIVESLLLVPHFAVFILMRTFIPSSDFAPLLYECIVTQCANDVNSAEALAQQVCTLALPTCLILKDCRTLVLRRSISESVSLLPCFGNFEFELKHFGLRFSLSIGKLSSCAQCVAFGALDRAVCCCVGIGIQCFSFIGLVFMMGLRHMVSPRSLYMDFQVCRQFTLHFKNPKEGRVMRVLKRNPIGLLICVW